MQAYTSCDPISILIVEDDVVTQKALCLAIDSEPALRLKGTFNGVKPTIEWLAHEKVDVLVTDLGLPDGSGIDIIHACKKINPSCEIIVITIASDERSVLACIEAGASGYILKDAGGMSIVRAILDLREGGAPMSPTVARMVLAKVRADKKINVPARKKKLSSPGLTERESTILDLIARGDSYNDAAKLLSLSVGTVQTHIKNIYVKLSVHSKSEAVFEAHRRGLLQFGSSKVKSK